MRRNESAKPKDPQPGRGDGMKMANKEGREKGRPEKGKQPSLKSDGMKVAMKGEASKKGSKLTSMKAARKEVR